MTKKKTIKPLLEYVIKKSYKDPEAMDALNKYDSLRTGLPFSHVELYNSLIRHGNTKLACRFLNSYHKNNLNKKI